MGMGKKVKRNVGGLLEGSTWSAKYVQLGAREERSLPENRCSQSEKMNLPWGFNVKRQAQWIWGSHGLNLIFLHFGNVSGVCEARKRKAPHIVDVNGICGHSASWALRIPLLSGIC